jgi:hypothetical protein
VTDQYAGQDTQAEGSVQEGSREELSFSADPVDHWEFSTTLGYPAECGTIVETDIYSPVGGGLLFQNPSRTNWGTELAPGSYKGIQMTTDHLTCVYVIPGGVHIDGASDSGYLTSVTGVLPS